MNFPSARNQHSLWDFRREMDRLFEDFWAVPAASGDLRATESHWAPACDVEEEKDHFLLTLEVPGLSREDLKIEFHEGQLAISGERKQEEKKSGGRYTERRYGKFYRAFSLPPGVDENRVEAQYKDGVLRVYVPKAEVAKPRQIKIGDGTSAGGSGFFGRLLGKADADTRTVETPKKDHVA